jgi:hypothetical protein
VKDGVYFLTEKDCSIGLMLTYLRNTVKNLTSGDIFKHLKIIIKSLRNEYPDTKESITTPFDGDGFKFTSADISGREGPTKNELIAHYDNEWTKNIKLFDSTKRGFQTVTFPKSGYYEITAAGAGQRNYGKGAVITGKVKIEKSSKIVLAVGQMGGHQFAGCGGTFVVKQTDDQCTPLVIAGGCGGFNSDYFIKQPKSHFLILKA